MRLTHLGSYGISSTRSDFLHPPHSPQWGFERVPNSQLDPGGEGPTSSSEFGARYQGNRNQVLVAGGFRQMR